MSRRDSAMVGEVVRWRRIALEKQLPTAHFPGGVRVPSAVCCSALVLVAVLCAVLFGAAAGQRVPQAVVDSQRQLVGGLARVLDNGVEATVDGMTEAAERYAEGAERDPAKVLDGLNNGAVRWAGTAVLDARTRQPLAARGEPVPIAQANPAPDRTTVKPLLQSKEPRVLVTVPLADGRLLAGMSVLRVRQLRFSPDQQQAILIGLAGAGTRVVQGADPSTDRDVMATVQQAVDRATDGDAASRTRTGPGQTALVVVAAPVGDSGLAIASAVRTPLVQAGPRWLGVPPAIGLLLAAAVAFLLLRLGVVRPVRRLLDMAKARACGVQPRGRTGFMLSEPRRIAAALAGQPGRKRGIPTVFAAVAAALVVAFWAVNTGITFGSGASRVPAQVVKDTGNQIESVAIALGDVLDTGRTQLSALARGEVTESALARLADQDSRYRSLYVADADGRPRLTVGRDPLRQQRPLPGDSGVRLDNRTGRLPVIYAHTRMPDGRSLVAEYDVTFLARLLERIDGRVRVVDPELRTILDTEGYRAFQPLQESASRAVLAKKQTTTTAEVLRSAGGWNPMLVASTPLSTPTTAAGLKWTVVAEQPVSELRLPPNDIRRAALLAAGAALVLAVVCLGWHYFVLLRPLRRLAVAAARLAAGRTEAVISPQRPDEIGAIAACLEICRQVRVDGERRLGGAARLRGSEHDFTTVIPAIKEPVLVKGR